MGRNCLSTPPVWWRSWGCRVRSSHLGWSGRTVARRRRMLLTVLVLVRGSGPLRPTLWWAAPEQVTAAPVGSQCRGLTRGNRMTATALVIALTSWPGQRPVNKPRKTSSMPRYGAILLFFSLRIFEVEQFLID